MGKLSPHPYTGEEDGVGVAEDPRTWLLHYEKICRPNGWDDDAAKLLNIAPFLVEEAGDWYDANAVWSGDESAGPYATFNRDVARWHAEALAGPPYNLPGRLALSPQDVARVVTRAVLSPIRIA
jgi:hypothetical protein